MISLKILKIENYIININIKTLIFKIIKFIEFTFSLIILNKNKLKLIKLTV